MKLRKTVYPVAIIVAVPLVIILFIVLNQGHFEQTINTAALKKEKTVEAYFLWDGFGTPKIKSVEIEGSETQLNRFDYYTNDAVEKMAPASLINDVKEYRPVLSVRAQTNDNKTIESMPRFVVRYSIFGINREQTIALQEGTDSNK